MKKLMIGCWVFLASLQVNAQMDSVHLQSSLSEKDKAILTWVGTMYEQGVRVEKDSVILSTEVQQILADDALRASLYPKEYTWEQAMSLMQHMELKKAFWFLINLYARNKELVMRTVLGYDELFEMDHALIAAFYTYAMLDPEVCAFVDGKPEVKRPDVLETKLASTREMVGYVLSFRAEANKN